MNPLSALEAVFDPQPGNYLAAGNAALASATANLDQQEAMLTGTAAPNYTPLLLLAGIGLVLYLVVKHG